MGPQVVDKWDDEDDAHSVAVGQMVPCLSAWRECSVQPVKAGTWVSL